MKQVESATEREVLAQADGRQDRQREFGVSSGRAAKADDRNYVLDFANGVITAEMTSGDHRLTLALTP